MQRVKSVYWQEDDAWLGYLEEYPDYWTQGETLEDLEEHLKDLYQDLTGGEIPGVRKVGELLEQITDENLHGEVETGPPVGNEVW